MNTLCRGCGQDDELRLGFCFDCASAGEIRAAKRTVIQHIGKGFSNIFAGKFDNSRFDFSWAWQRLTRTRDYADGGYFDSEGIDWRRP